MESIIGKNGGTTMKRSISREAESASVTRRAIDIKKPTRSTKPR
jgi:hypothetical protein